MTAYISILWQLVLHKVNRYWNVEQAYDVKVSDSGKDEVRLATFKFRGRSFRGHFLPGTECPRQPWLQGATMSLKRPLKAYDAKGQDVSMLMREFWGPCGNWNKGLNMCISLKHMDAPITVRFNDMTTVILTGQGEHEAWPTSGNE